MSNSRMSFVIINVLVLVSEWARLYLLCKWLPRQCRTEKILETFLWVLTIIIAMSFKELSLASE